MSRKFGVEIENLLSVSEARSVLIDAGINVANDVHNNYDHITRRSWKVVTDGSVSSGCEIVSPPLSGDEGFAELRRVTEALDRAGARVNRQCGLHVHVDASDLRPIDVKSLVQHYADNEIEIDSFMPPSRRASNNTYCQTMRRVTLRGTSIEQMAQNLGGRYWKVNLASYLRYRTIEFRQHSGTTNPQKIENWVHFLLAFVQGSIVEGDAPQMSNDSMSRLMDLSRGARAVFENLQRGPMSGEDLASRTGLGFESVRSAISHLRRAGFSISLDRRMNRYHIVTDTANVEVSNVQLKGMWDGVPATVVEFFKVRREAFASLNEELGS